MIMNNENNNLNGVVLGNVNPSPVINPSSNTVTNPENVVITPNQTITPLNSVQPSVAPSVTPANNAINSQVVMPTNNAVQNPKEPVSNNAQPVTSNVQSSQPIQSSQAVNPTLNDVPVIRVNEQSVNNNTQSAFTSISAIEQNNSNQNFEKSIGTNPPISLEKEKQPKKKGNKTLFIVIVILLLLAVALGTYYILNYTDLLSKKETITINTNNLTISLGDSISNNINDYANIIGTNSSNCTLDTSNVDITKVGIYKYTITCSNKTKEGNLVVIDDKPINVETKTVYLASGDTIEAKDFIKKVDNNLTYEFVSQDEVDAILNSGLGTYSVKIKAISSTGKETEVLGKLVKIQYRLKGYLVCKAPNQNMTNPVISSSYKFAIVDDGNNGFGNIVHVVNSFKYSNEDEYSQIVSDYNTNGSVTINNITGDTEFDDSNLTVTITTDIDSSTLKERYGANNFSTYSTIRNYYITNLGYECSYEKAND